MFSPIQYMINAGVPSETVIFLLALPLAATVIAFARQIVGIKGFGIYTPLILAFAFLTTGLKYGLAFFVVIILAGTLSRLLIKRFRLLYLPRMAIVLSIVVLAILTLFFIGAYAGRLGLTSSSIFAVLIMITLVEKFVAAQIERGAREAVTLTMETLLLSLVCYWLISWSWLQTTALNYPAVIFIIAIIANVIIGKWTGLRLSEYFRFYAVLKNIELSSQKKK